MNPYNPALAARNAVQWGKVEMIKQFMEKVDVNVQGNELIQTAIHFKQARILQYFLDQGATLAHAPPATITKLWQEERNESEFYRPAPWLIQAACAGDVDVFKIVHQVHSDMRTTGNVCLSRKKKNQVHSNIYGAAAYHGNYDLLRFTQNKTKILDINYQAYEINDKGAKITKEWTGYTPLMLAVAGAAVKSLDCIKLMLLHKVDPTTSDHEGNTALHICVYHANNAALDWLVKNTPIDIFARNSKGETALSIAKEKHDQEAIDIIESIMQNDQSKQVYESLINEMEAEEEKEAAKKGKKKERKRKNKMKQIADKEGISVD